MRAMEELAEEGSTKLIGVSNFSVSQVEEARGHLQNHELVANQGHYSLKEKDPEITCCPTARGKRLP
jgi:diketogulonate reductase-like aldo/keto reductase